MINQILKYSETDKEQAIKHMTNLFKGSVILDKNPDSCKGLVEDYLKKPYITDADLHHQRND